MTSRHRPTSGNEWWVRDSEKQLHFQTVTQAALMGLTLQAGSLETAMVDYSLEYIHQSPEHQDSTPPR